MTAVRGCYERLEQRQPDVQEAASAHHRSPTECEPESPSSSFFKTLLLLFFVVSFDLEQMLLVLEDGGLHAFSGGGGVGSKVLPGSPGESARSQAAAGGRASLTAQGHFAGASTRSAQEGMCTSGKVTRVFLCYLTGSQNWVEQGD